ncbi:hypothetical protein [Siphonobacter curvatus]|uniref:hypothetical protein n=1 Tax=Siphonobacter curvatus TaxID=2094562 RepID=UPI001056F23C|nr:hypothetical protein [Siphonobacter curvatus]
MHAQYQQTKNSYAFEEFHAVNVRSSQKELKISSTYLTQREAFALGSVVGTSYYSYLCGKFVLV